MALAFSPEAGNKIDELVRRYPERQAALIPVLWLAQREFGTLTTEVMSLVATTLELPESKVVNTATFYTMLHKRPIGRCHLQICKNISCWLQGSDELEKVVKKKLGIGSGETTPDKLFTLERVECLAACGRGPVVRVDETYHEQMTPQKLADLLDELKAKLTAEAAAGGGSNPGGEA